MTDKEMKLAALEAELEKYRAQCESIAAEMQESRKSIRKDALSNLRMARSEYNDANIEHEKADDNRDACRAALCGCVIGQREPDEVQREVRNDIEKSLKYKNTAERKNRLWPVIAIFVLAIACAAASEIFSTPTYYGTAALVLLGVFMMRKHRLDIDESKGAESRRAAILAKYRADDEIMIKARETEFLELSRIFAEAEEKEHSTALRLEQCRLRLEELENHTLEELDFTGGSGEAAELTRLFNERSQMCQNIVMEIEKLKSE